MRLQLTDLSREFLSFPRLDHTLRLEVVECVKVETGVFRIDLGGFFLSTLDDLIDVVVDQHTALSARPSWLLLRTSESC
jgi:hypothetical protein